MLVWSRKHMEPLTKGKWRGGDYDGIGWSQNGLVDVAKLVNSE